MPQKKNRSLSVAFMLVATLGLMGLSVLGAQAEGGKDSLSELVDAWRELEWVGFVSVEVGLRTVHGAVDPSHGTRSTYFDWEAAGYGHRDSGRFGSGYTLTASFDTRDKALQETLQDKAGFQYPVLGDASVSRSEAPSRAPIYLRVEREDSYFMYGDYRTGLSSGRLVVYDRYLTGPKLHYVRRTDGGMWQSTLIAAHSRQRTKTDHIPSAGTVGFYGLTESTIVPGSEQVYIVPVGGADGIDGPLRRDVDYTIDYLEGTLLFRQPVPLADGEGNEYEIVVRYEYESGEVMADVIALRTKYETARWQVGLIHVRDDLGAADGAFRQVTGLDGRTKVAPWLQVEAEWATGSARVAGVDQQGDAYRLGVSGDVSDEWAYEAVVGRQNPGFVQLHNELPSPGGSEEAELQVHYHPLLDRDGTELRTTLSHGIHKTISATGDARFQRYRTRVAASYRIDSWTVDGHVQSGQYEQFGNDADRWTATGYRIGAAYRFAEGHELGAFRTGSTSSSSMTSITEQSGVTGIHYDHNLDERTDLKAGVSVADGGNQRFWVGLGRRVVDNDRWKTDVYTRYQLDGTASGRRAGTILGVTNRWEVTEAVGVDFGYERTQGLVSGHGEDASFDTPPGSTAGSSSSPTPAREAWNVSVRYIPDMPYRVAITYSTGRHDGRSTEHIQLSGFGQLAQDWSVSGVLSSSSGPTTAAGGGKDGTRQRQTIGLAYRPIHNSRLNGLLALERRATGRTDESVTFSAEAAYELTADLEVAGKIARRNVSVTAAPAPEVRTATTLYQARGTYAWSPRWDGTVIYRTLQQQLNGDGAGTLYQSGYQLSVGYAFIEEDPRWRAEAGYRYADFAPEDDPSADAFVEGPFVRLTYRF